MFYIHVFNIYFVIFFLKTSEMTNRRQRRRRVENFKKNSNYDDEND